MHKILIQFKTKIKGSKRLHNSLRLKCRKKTRFPTQKKKLLIDNKIDISIPIIASKGARNSFKNIREFQNVVRTLDVPNFMNEKLVSQKSSILPDLSQVNKEMLSGHNTVELQFIENKWH